MKHLIVNADDFGMSPAINRGIIKAYEQGIVTSASLMVRWPEAPAAAAYSRNHPQLSVGLHVDLGEWAYRDEAWIELYQVVSLDNHEAVAEEISHQLEAFRELIGRDPTHLDSHQHAHLEEPIRSCLEELAGRLHVPLRQCAPRIHYCGSFYGQDGKGWSFPEFISPASLIQILRDIQPGITELACHPGEGEDLLTLDTVYRMEREHEVRALCDSRVRSAILEAGIELVSFKEITNCQRILDTD
ncbi:MAG: ChbG/HpnK family deacetylase [Chloroflexi bacterium]|nr:ChbG/HpnK family deacetylase [Chloroflexota bacterium]